MQSGQVVVLLSQIKTDERSVLQTCLPVSGLEQFMNRSTLIAAALITLPGLAAAQPYGHGMMWGDGWGMYGLMHILWWLLAAVVVVMLVRRSFRRHDSGFHRADRAMDILRERYARGEIDKNEYDARRRDLMS
jgi:putative membrane protein